MTEKPLCFVIGPIGDKDSVIREQADKFYDRVVSKALADTFRIKRADKDHRTGVLIGQIIHDLEEATLIVADLRDHNPNVLYEVGIAHTLCKPIVKMKPVGEKLRFDISGVRAFDYSLDSVKGMNAAARLLRTAAEENLKSKPDNPVIQAMGERNYAALLRRLAGEERMGEAIAEAKTQLELEHQGQIAGLYDKIEELKESLAKVAEKRTLAEESLKATRTTLAAATAERDVLRKQVASYAIPTNLLLTQPAPAITVGEPVRSTVTFTGAFSGDQTVKTGGILKFGGVDLGKTTDSGSSLLNPSNSKLPPSGDKKKK
jgi:hypothetical protein